MLILQLTRTKQTLGQLSEILLKAENLFLNYGIKAVSMDDLSRQLGISKKTLYKFIPNKTELVIRTIKEHLEEEERAVNQITKESQNAIDEIIKICNYVCVHLRKLNPATVYDLQKYHQEAWKLHESFREGFIKSVINNNLKRGIEEGWYRDNLETEIIARFYLICMIGIVDPQLFPIGDINFTDRYTTFIKFYLRGISTEKGIDYLNKNEKAIG